MFLKKQIELKRQSVSEGINEVCSNWMKLKSDAADNLSSSHAFIWAAVTGFIIAEIFHPSKRKLLLGFWPLFTRLGRYLRKKA